MRGDVGGVRRAARQDRRANRAGARLVRALAKRELGRTGGGEFRPRTRDPSPTPTTSAPTGATLPTPP